LYLGRGFLEKTGATEGQLRRIDHLAAARRRCSATVDGDRYRFQSRMGTMAKIFPFASVNRKLSGSRPEWRLITSGARVFAAAIASSLVPKTQISFSTGTAPFSQSTKNKGGLLPLTIARASF
jgi:hypothetical protein